MQEKKTRLIVASIFHGIFLVITILSFFLGLFGEGFGVSGLSSIASNVIVGCLSVTLNFIFFLSFDYLSRKPIAKSLYVIGTIVVAALSAVGALNSWHFSLSDDIAPATRSFLTNLIQGVAIAGTTESVVFLLMKNIFHTEFDKVKYLFIAMGAAILPIAIGAATFFVGTVVNMIVRCLLILGEGIIASNFIAYFLTAWKRNGLASNAVRIVLTVITAIALFLTTVGLLLEEPFFNLGYLPFVNALMLIAAWITTFFNFNKKFKSKNIKTTATIVAVASAAFVIAVVLTILSLVNPQLILILFVVAVIAIGVISFVRAVKYVGLKGLFDFPAENVSIEQNEKINCWNCIYHYSGSDFVSRCQCKESEYYCRAIQTREQQPYDCEKYTKHSL